MPFYDYQCKHGHVFEELCSMSDRKRKKECPECGEKGKFRISVHQTKPSFGNNDRHWDFREKHRLGLKQ